MVIIIFFASISYASLHKCFRIESVVGGQKKHLENDYNYKLGAGFDRLLLFWDAVGGLTGFDNMLNWSSLMPIAPI